MKKSLSPRPATIPLEGSVVVKKTPSTPKRIDDATPAYEREWSRLQFLFNKYGFDYEQHLQE